ncbi:hypothetical protein [Natrinema ejinorense]|nr:hypothetical protein [Natrinema ejinorense]
MSCWLYIECPVCGDRIPVATDHESVTEALETHKRALHPSIATVLEA